MNLREYNGANYLQSDEDIYLYLEGELDANEMPYVAKALGVVIEARGGVEVDMRETGIAASKLLEAADVGGSGGRVTIMHVMKAYRARVPVKTLVA